MTKLEAGERGSRVHPGGGPSGERWAVEQTGPGSQYCHSLSAGQQRGHPL